jgi:2-iminobutanoate/2-iminopropanoate deaminase
MAHTPVRPLGVHEPSGYSHAVRAGKTVYISGQVPRDRLGNSVGADDFEAQLWQVYANLRNVLEEAGGGIGDVVKVTTLLTRLGDFEAWRRIRGEVFAEPFPASTLVVVESLSHPEYLVEVEAIAVLED